MLIVEEKSTAIKLGKEERTDLTLWCDGSKLNHGGAGAAVVWKNEELSREWQEKKAGLGKIKKY